MQDTEEPTGESLPHFPGGSGAGFTTASGKAVKVSEEALKKAALLWQTIEQLDITTETKNPWEDVKVPLSFQNAGEGFTTASGKNVQVSEEALKRAKLLWNDVEDISERIEQTGATPADTPDEEFHSPLRTSTPKSLDLALDRRPKTRGFVTPFKPTKPVLTDQRVISTPTVLDDRRVSQLKGPTKTLGGRPLKFTPPFRSPRMVDSLKRVRNSSEDPPPNGSSNKSVKLNNSSSTSHDNSGSIDCPSPMNASVTESPNTSSMCVSYTESQEIMLSSKALLDQLDDEFDDEFEKEITSYTKPDLNSSPVPSEASSPKTPPLNRRIQPQWVIKGKRK